MRPRPLFAVGEEVMICSRANPEINGRTEIISLLWRESGRDYTTNRISGPGWRYQTTDNIRPAKENVIRKLPPLAKREDSEWQPTKEPIHAN